MKKCGKLINHQLVRKMVPNGGLPLSGYYVIDNDSEICCETNLTQMVMHMKSGSFANIYTPPKANPSLPNTL